MLKFKLLFILKILIILKMIKSQTLSKNFLLPAKFNNDQEELIADIIAIYGDEIIYITNKVFRKMKRGE